MIRIPKFQQKNIARPGNPTGFQSSSSARIIGDAVSSIGKNVAGLGTAVLKDEKRKKAAVDNEARYIRRRDETRKYAREQEARRKKETSMERLAREASKTEKNVAHLETKNAVSAFAQNVAVDVLNSEGNGATDLADFDKQIEQGLGPMLKAFSEKSGGQYDSMQKSLSDEVIAGARKQLTTSIVAKNIKDLNKRTQVVMQHLDNQTFADPESAHDIILDKQVLIGNTLSGDNETEASQTAMDKAAKSTLATAIRGFISPLRKGDRVKDFRDAEELFKSPYAEHFSGKEIKELTSDIHKARSLYHQGVNTAYDRDLKNKDRVNKEIRDNQDSKSTALILKAEDDGDYLLANRLKNAELQRAIDENPAALSSPQLIRMAGRVTNIKNANSKHGLAAVNDVLFKEEGWARFSEASKLLDRQVKEHIVTREDAGPKYKEIQAMKSAFVTKPARSKRFRAGWKRFEARFSTKEHWTKSFETFQLTPKAFEAKMAIISQAEGLWTHFESQGGVTAEVASVLLNESMFPGGQGVDPYPYSGNVATFKKAYPKLVLAPQSLEDLKEWDSWAKIQLPFKGRALNNYKTWRITTEAILQSEERRKAGADKNTQILKDNQEYIENYEANKVMKESEVYFDKWLNKPQNGALPPMLHKGMLEL